MVILKKARLRALTMVGLILIIISFFVLQLSASIGENEKQEPIYWFSVTSSGAIGTFLYEGNNEPCEGGNILCAVGLLESRSEVDPGDGTSDPTATISNPNQALHKSMSND